MVHGWKWYFWDKLISSVMLCNAVFMCHDKVGDKVDDNFDYEVDDKVDDDWRSWQRWQSWWRNFVMTKFRRQKRHQNVKTQHRRLLRHGTSRQQALRSIWHGSGILEIFWDLGHFYFNEFWSDGTRSQTHAKLFLLMSWPTKHHFHVCTIFLGKMSQNSNRTMEHSIIFLHIVKELHLFEMDFLTV